MPEFLVVRCYEEKCGAFQVTQEKKVSKWKCVCCGASQSVRTVFVRSSRAADCRVISQEYNMKRKTVDDAKLIASSISTSETATPLYGSPLFPAPLNLSQPSKSPGPGSKWTKYLEPNDSNSDGEAVDDQPDDPRFTTVSESAIERGTKRSSVADRGRSPSPLPFSSSSSFSSSQSTFTSSSSPSSSSSSSSLPSKRSRVR